MPGRSSTSSPTGTRSRPPRRRRPSPSCPLFRCAACRDTGRVIKPSAWFPGKAVEGFCPACAPHYDFQTQRFLNCAAGADQAGESAPPPTPVRRFDRASHCQRIGQAGGMTTFQRYGSAHMRAIGKAGHAAAVKAHGVAYVAGLLTAKRWAGPRRPELLTDLAAGRVLADLDRAA